MRILFLTNHYPPDAYGGYELCCRDVVERMQARGHAVEVLTSDHRAVGAAAPAATKGPPALRSLPLTWDHGHPPAKWRRPGVERVAQRVLSRAIAGHRPDVVSVWNMAGLPGSLLTTVVDAAPALVCVFADAWPERVLAGDPWLGPLARHPTAARVVGRATGLPTAVPDLGASSFLCFCSDQLRMRIAAATGWDVEGSSITPLGVDRHDFPGPAAGAPRPWSGHLLFVGRLDPVKGIDTLIRALPLLPGTRLRVMGPPEPAHLERLARLADAVGVTERVEFGSAARSELPAVYEAADACIFPSEWDEPFGIVPLEAMACGTPVVATGRGGSGEFLRDGENAVCFDAGDPQALAAAVARLAAEPALRRQVVAGGLETAAALTVDRLADQLEEVHARAAAGGRSA